MEPILGGGWSRDLHLGENRRDRMPTALQGVGAGAVSVGSGWLCEWEAGSTCECKSDELVFKSSWGLVYSS